MSEKTDIPSPVEIIPSVQHGISAIASAHAPFLYFDGAPTFGTLNGIIQITLDASRIMAGPEGPRFDRVITAHLRMSIAAAESLKAAIDGALLLAKPAPSETKN